MEITNIEIDELSKLILLTGLRPIKITYDKGRQFNDIVDELLKEDYTYENLLAEVALLFKDKTYKESINLLKRITKDFKKGMKNNKL